MKGIGTCAPRKEHLVCWIEVGEVRHTGGIDKSRVVEIRSLRDDAYEASNDGRVVHKVVLESNGM